MTELQSGLWDCHTVSIVQQSCVQLHQEQGLSLTPALLCVNCISMNDPTQDPVC